MSTYYFKDGTACNSRIVKEDNSTYWADCNVQAADFAITDKFCFEVQYCYSVSACNKDTAATNLKLQFQQDSGSWEDLGTDIAAYACSGITNDAAQSSSHCTDPSGGECANGFTNGKQCTDGTVTHSCLAEYYTTLIFGLNPASAVAGSSYRFRLYDTTNNAPVPSVSDATNGTLLAYITIATVGGAEYNESITENFGMVESPGLGATFAMNIVENMSSGEAYSPQAINQVALSELMAMIEQIGSVASYSWKHEELLAMAETTQVGLDLTISATEFGAFTDRKSASGDYGLLLSENVALSDVLSLAQLIRLMVDYFSFAAITAGAEYNEAVTETLALTDSLHLNLQSTDALIETLAATDLLKAQLGVTGNITEALAITDQIKSILSGHILLTESLALTDQIRAALEASLTIIESVAITDLVETLPPGQSFSETLTEAIALVDQLKASLETSAVITENISLADVLRLTVQTYLRLSEYISLTEEILAPIGQLFQEVIVEQLKLSEAQQVQLLTHLGISETMSLADAFTAIIQVYLQIRETIGVIDTIDIPRLGVEFAEALTETLGITESKAMVIAYGLMLTESLAFYDEKTQTFTFNIKISEDVAISDVIRPILSLGMLITENFTVGDVQVLTRTSPTIIIRRGKTFVFTIDTVGPQTGVAPKKGHIDVKKWH